MADILLPSWIPFWCPCCRQFPDFFVLNLRRFGFHFSPQKDSLCLEFSARLPDDILPIWSLGTSILPWIITAGNNPKLCTFSLSSYSLRRLVVSTGSLILDLMLSVSRAIFWCPLEKPFFLSSYPHASLRVRKGSHCTGGKDFPANFALDLIMDHSEVKVSTVAASFSQCH